MELEVPFGLLKTFTTCLQRFLIWPTWSEVGELPDRYLADNLYFDSQSKKGLRSWPGIECRVDAKSGPGLSGP